jgi:Flp pilus assembly protein TadG
MTYCSVERQLNGRWTCKLVRSCLGVTALEFGIVAPVFMLMLVAIFWLGLAAFYEMCLDDAVRDAARQLQIGGPAMSSGSGFTAAVCNEFGIIAPKCSTNLTYNIQAQPAVVTATGVAGLFASMAPVSLPSSGKLPMAFPSIAAGSRVVIQVAYPLPVTVPFIGKWMTLTGTNSLLSTTTVLVEPYG